MEDIAYNESLISSLESKINAIESELVTLKDIISGPGRSSMSRITNRAGYLTDKILDAQQKVARLEKENVELKKVLDGKSEIKSDTSSWWVFW